MYLPSLIINRNDNCRERIIIFWQYIKYYNIKSMPTYLYSICIIKNLYNKKIKRIQKNQEKNQKFNNVLSKYWKDSVCL